MFIGNSFILLNSIIKCSLFLVIIRAVFLAACTFDEVQLPLYEIRNENVAFRPSLRFKREHSKSFNPIRIHAHYDTFTDLKYPEIDNLKHVVNASISKISRLLSVIPTEANLLLKRNKACSQFYNSDSSTKRCASIRKGYKQEYCRNKVDSFIIPKEHLLGVTVYDQNGENLPLVSISSGTGIPNTDFILYMASKTTDYCQQQNVIAYSSICQLDETDKPVAGFVNFCPMHLSSALSSSQKVELTLIHELLHILGFSAELFSKFRECDDFGGCFERKAIIHDKGRILMVLPSVIDQMQLHFRCSDPDFGAPLEILKNNQAGSHWDSMILHNSIMAPYLNELTLTSIDPISAALFENTGWYKVNYSATDPYLWGKGSGCNLEKFDYCDYEYSCKMSDSSQMGCDVSHTSVGSCKAIPNQPCGFYELSDTKCSEDFSKACFIVSYSNKTDGNCLNFRCEGEDLKIEFKEHWFRCPSQSQVDTEFLPEFNVISCPDSTVLCQLGKSFSSPASYLDLKSNQLELSQLEPECSQFWIKFSTPLPNSIQPLPFKNNLSLSNAAVQQFADTAGIPNSWISEYELTVRGSFYWLYVCLGAPPNSTLGTNISQEITQSLEELMKNGTLTMDLHYPELRLASHRLIIEPIKGLVALWIIGCVFIGSVIVAVIITSYFKRHSRSKFVI